MNEQAKEQIDELKKKVYHINIGFDEVDYAFLTKRARQFGMKTSAYVRRIVALYLIDNKKDIERCVLCGRKID